MTFTHTYRRTRRRAVVALAALPLLFSLMVGGLVSSSPSRAAAATPAAASSTLPVVHTTKGLVQTRVHVKGKKDVAVLWRDKKHRVRMIQFKKISCSGWMHAWVLNPSKSRVILETHLKPSAKKGWWHTNITTTHKVTSKNWFLAGCDRVKPKPRTLNLKNYTVVHVR